MGGSRSIMDTKVGRVNLLNCCHKIYACAVRVLSPSLSGLGVIKIFNQCILVIDSLTQKTYCRQAGPSALASKCKVTY